MENKKLALAEAYKDIKSIEKELKDAKKLKCSRYTIKRLESDLEKAHEKQMNIICSLLE